MSRLQKKCLIATAGFHLLLVLTLVFGSAFVSERTKPDNVQVLEVIPDTVVEAVFNSGTRNPQPPAPKPAKPVPIVTPPAPLPKPQPQVQPQPEPPAPKPELVKHSEPKPETKPEPKPETRTKPKSHKIDINLKPVTRHAPSAADARAAEQRRQQEAKLKAIAAAASAIKANASSSTEVEMPGASDASHAQYASVVKTIYERAWIPPNDTSSDDADIKVSVTIGSDGHVITSRILDRSGDSRVDASVQKALDRVTFVKRFPDDWKEKQRTFIINFNLKAKRMLG